MHCESPAQLAWRILLKLDEQFLAINIVRVKIQTFQADDLSSGFKTSALDVLKNRQLKGTQGFSYVSTLH